MLVSGTISSNEDGKSFLVVKELPWTSESVIVFLKVRRRAG